MTIIEQKILSGGGTSPEAAIDSLENQVNRHLKMGWELHGQAFAIPDPRGSAGGAFFTIAQQIVKKN
ncbi:DUF1737 domain-containing protein [Chromobacterium violaceum]|uniref:DUF1737 domain-containing protein n=1 Tax=Chromobacterium violaceum TaxID=536 RepID=UPI001124ECBD|nr:DUF1737 domain-containing protein [Chromobacterium violaceum]